MLMIGTNPMKNFNTQTCQHVWTSLNPKNSFYEKVEKYFAFFVVFVFDSG